MSYNAVPYVSEAFPATHPKKIHNILKKNNLKILEIGAGQGINVIPLAFYNPNYQIFAIDNSTSHVNTANNIKNKLKLDNISFQQIDILDFNVTEKFDYIICHGVFSWVNRECQDKIISIFKNNLADEGLAYCSYNTYPGWYDKMPIRELLLQHTKNIANPIDKILASREVLEQIRTVKHPKLYNDEIDRLLDKYHCSYLYHEYLEEVNQPLFYTEFCQRLNDLIPLFDATTLKQDDEVSFDWINWRSFRQTIIGKNYIEPTIQDDEEIVLCDDELNKVIQEEIGVKYVIDSRNCTKVIEL